MFLQVHYHSIKILKKDIEQKNISVLFIRNSITVNGYTTVDYSYILCFIVYCAAAA